MRVTRTTDAVSDAASRAALTSTSGRRDPSGPMRTVTSIAEPSADWLTRVSSGRHRAKSKTFCLPLSVTDNVIMKKYQEAPIGRGLTVDAKAAEKFAKELKETYDIIAPSVKTHRTITIVGRRGMGPSLHGRRRWCQPDGSGRYQGDTAQDEEGVIRRLHNALSRHELVENAASNLWRHACRCLGLVEKALRAMQCACE